MWISRRKKSKRSCGARRPRSRCRRRSATKDDYELGHLLADTELPLPEDAAQSVSRTAALADCLDSLNDRQRTVLELRYGLDGEHPRTLDEIGLVFSLTRERIRQIERQSLAKLAALAEAQQLRSTPLPLPETI